MRQPQQAIWTGASKKITFMGPLLLIWVNFNAWISNHMPSNVWDDISYPFPNFNGYTVEVWEWTIPLHIIIDVITYLCCD